MIGIGWKCERWRVDVCEDLAVGRSTAMSVISTADTWSERMGDLRSVPVQVRDALMDLTSGRRCMVF